jgi:hypothetical protein
VGSSSIGTIQLRTERANLGLGGLYCGLLPGDDPKSTVLSRVIRFCCLRKWDISYPSLPNEYNNPFGAGFELPLMMQSKEDFLDGSFYI